jgi:hypothetical protein
MPTEPEPLTLAEVVHRAVEICDDGSGLLDDLLTHFEDADEPISSVENIEQRLDETVGPPDADGYEAPFTMARAVIVYLRYRRDQFDTDPDELLRLAARAEFDGDPPEPVAQWLAQHGVSDV